MTGREIAGTLLNEDFTFLGLDIDYKSCFSTSKSNIDDIINHLGKKYLPLFISNIARQYKHICKLALLENKNVALIGKDKMYYIHNKEPDLERIYDQVIVELKNFINDTYRITL